MMDDETAQLDPITRLFGIEVESKLKNIETEAEPEIIMNEHVLKLSCHIDNNNNPINTLEEGL